MQTYFHIQSIGTFENLKVNEENEAVFMISSGR